MSETTGDPASELHERVRELEEENARLAAASDHAPAAGAIARRRRFRPGWWRAPLSALCIVVAAVLVPVSIVAAWARAEMVDEDRFVAMLGPLAQDPAVQLLVIDQTMTAVEQKVDFEQITGSVIDGVAGLGLPARATDALDLLRQPAADGLRTLVRNAVTGVVESDAFAATWTTAVRSAHRVVSTTATSDGGGIVVLTDEGLGVRLGPIVEQVKSRLVDRGVGAAALIPAVDRTIIVGEGDAVRTVRLVYGGAVVAGTWLPLVTLAVFLGGILLARRRSIAVVGAGLAVALGGASLALGLGLGSVAVTAAAQKLQLSPSAFGVVYATLVSDMEHTAGVVAIVGVFIAILGWAFGATASARRTRAVVGGVNASARRALTARGMDTGRFGDAVWAARAAIRVGVAVLAVVWLILLRPLSIGEVALVVVVAVVVAWLFELVQRRPDERRAPDDAAVPVTEDRDTASTGVRDSL